VIGGGACGQMIGVFVLWVTVVAADPAPLDFVAAGADDAYKLVPEGEVLDRAAFAYPAAGGPAEDPVAEAIYEIAGVAGEHDSCWLAFGRQRLERLYS